MHKQLALHPQPAASAQLQEQVQVSVQHLAYLGGRHLSEWQAYSAREIIFHLDQTVEAKNMAQAQARASRGRAPRLGAELPWPLSR